MTRQSIPIPESELRELRGYFNENHSRDEKGDLTARRGSDPFEEWLFRQAILPLILAVNYPDRDDVTADEVSVGDDSRLSFESDQ